MQLIAEAPVPGTVGVATCQPPASTSSATGLTSLNQRAQAQREQESDAEQVLGESITNTLQPSDSGLEAGFLKDGSDSGFEAGGCPED